MFVYCLVYKYVYIFIEADNCLKAGVNPLLQVTSGNSHNEPFRIICLSILNRAGFSLTFSAFYVDDILVIDDRQIHEGLRVIRVLICFFLP